MQKKLIYVIIMSCFIAMTFCSCGKTGAENDIPTKPTKPVNPTPKPKPNPNPNNPSGGGDNNPNNPNGGGNNPNNPGGGGNSNTEEETPEPSIIIERINIGWKQGVDPLSFDIEPLLIFGFNTPENSQKYNMEYLSKYAYFHTTPPGKYDTFYFKQKQLDRMRVTNIEIKDGRIIFSITYNGHEIVYDRGRRPSLSFDMYSYIGSKIRPNQEYISRKFMRGEAEDFGGDIGNLFKYNDEYYELDNIHCNHYDYNNSISYSFTVKNRQTNKEIGPYNNTLTGFRPLSDLSKVIRLEYTDIMKTDLKDKIKKRINDNEDHDVKEIIRGLIENKMKETPGYINFINKNTSKPLAQYNNIVRGGAGMLDLYLTDIRWELNSGRIKDHKLYINATMTFANDVYVNIPFEIVIPDMYFAN